MRRARRTRMSTNRNNIVRQLAVLAKEDNRIFTAIKENNSKLAFGRLLHKWIDTSTRESVIDIYVDEEAIDAVSYAINIVRKSLV